MPKNMRSIRPARPPILLYHGAVFAATNGSVVTIVAFKHAKNDVLIAGRGVCATFVQLPPSNVGAFDRSAAVLL